MLWLSQEMDVVLNFCITCLVSASWCSCDENITHQQPPSASDGKCSIGNYPYYVVIKLGDGFCGGSILSQKHILTAGHCCTGQYSEIYTGFKNMVNYEQKISMKSYQKHRLYTGGEPIIMNDFCIMTLQQKLKFSKSTQLVKLPRANFVQNPSLLDKPYRSEARFIGYSQDYHTKDSYSDIDKTGFGCLSTNLSLHTVCQQSINGYHQENMICALDANSVPGDSGGPILLEDIQVAILSRRQEPVLGARIDNQLQWIVQIKDGTISPRDLFSLNLLCLCVGILFLDKFK